MTTAETSRAGKWRTSIVPYLHEPMTNLSLYNLTRKVVLKFAAQMGKSECGLNAIGWIIDCAPCSIMILRPTVDDCEIYSTQRLTHLLAIPKLKRWVSTPKSRSGANKKLLKEHVGGVLFLAGANAPSRLASTPVRFLHADEPDRYTKSAGKEGSPLWLARRRQTQYGERSKELLSASPTMKGDSVVDAEFNLSSQGHWHMPCPQCGEYQELLWGERGKSYHKDRYIHWTGNPDGSDDNFDVWIECRHCHERIEEKDKGKMLARGKWVHEYPNRNTKGYQINILSAPPGWASWRMIVEEYEIAMAGVRAGNNEDWQTFINLRLAETWEDLGEQVDAGTLEYRREDYIDEDGKIPKEILAITMGVDVHDDRLEAEIVGWGLGHENWSLGYYVIPIDPRDQGSWDAVDELLAEPWTKKDGRSMRVDFCCIDSGYGAQEVYDYTAPRRKRKVFAIKGMFGPNRPIWDRKARKGGGRKGRQTATGTFHLVGVDSAKDTMAAYLRVKKPGPGYCHFPEGRSEEVPDYFMQLASEHRVGEKDKRGRIRWVWKVRTGRQNHAWDVRIYNLAALHGLRSLGRRMEGARPPRPTGQLTAPRAKPTKGKHAKGSYFK